MKEKIHPPYHEITVQMTDGTRFVTRSTYGKKGDVLKLDVDPTTHPAWTGQKKMTLTDKGRMARFNRMFGTLGKGDMLETTKADDE